MQQFPHTARKTEFIKPFIHPPWWLPKAQITIADTKDDAKAMHDKILQNTHPGTTQFIYTDGSGIQEKIGVAIFEPAMNAATQQHLGSEIDFNVFAAEVSALATAAEVALHSNRPKRNIIFTDSVTGLGLTGLRFTRLAGLTPNISILTGFTWCRHGITKFFSNQLYFNLLNLILNPSTPSGRVTSLLHPSILHTPFTDSQAAAKAVDNPWRQSGQSIIKRFLDTADKLQSSHSIQIIWIPCSDVRRSSQTGESTKNRPAFPGFGSSSSYNS